VLHATGCWRAGPGGFAAADGHDSCAVYMSLNQSQSRSSVQNSRLRAAAQVRALQRSAPARPCAAGRRAAAGRRRAAEAGARPRRRARWSPGAAAAAAQARRRRAGRPACWIRRRAHAHPGRRWRMSLVRRPWRRRRPAAARARCGRPPRRTASERQTAWRSRGGRSMTLTLAQQGSLARPCTRACASCSCSWQRCPAAQRCLWCRPTIARPAPAHTAATAAR